MPLCLNCTLAVPLLYPGLRTYPAGRGGVQRDFQASQHELRDGHTGYGEAGAG